MEKKEYTLTYQTNRERPRKDRKSPQEYVQTEAIPLSELGIGLLEAVCMVGQTINGKKVVGVIR